MPSLWERTAAAGALDARFVADERGQVQLGALAHATSLAGGRAGLRCASVLIAPGTQRDAAIALLELDGWARRIVLCPPDLGAEHMPSVLAATEATHIIAQAPDPDCTCLPCIPVAGAAMPCDRGAAPHVTTEWILFTSGTTGRPKMVVHTLDTLVGAIKPSPAPDTSLVWSTFYDIRRYGGLQILLRALLGSGSLVLSAPGEASDAFIARAKAAGVTHLSGTPSHWRRAILGSAFTGFTPSYVRLSGEAADQAVLDRLRQIFPDATVAHAFASTEAGVAFEVRDGLAGLPASFIHHGPEGVELRVTDGTLRIRSPRIALRYLDPEPPPLVGDDGFVDTKDMLEQRGERHHFIGRSDAVINVGGLKVHPEEVEAVLNRHPLVHLSLVKGRRSPLVGAVVVADVMLSAAAECAGRQAETAILDACRQTLPGHKVPAAIRFVSSLPVSAAGKLARSGA